MFRIAALPRLVTIADMGPIILSLFSGLAGAWISDWFHRRRQDIERSRKAIATLRAIVAELKALDSLFTEAAAPFIKPEDAGKPIPVGFNIKETYFIIYRANASAIGEIKDEQLARQIIEFVTLSQFFSDDLRMHTEVLEAHRRTGNLLEKLVITSDILRHKYSSLKNSLPRLLDRIDAYCKREAREQEGWLDFRFCDSNDTHGPS